VQPHTRYTTSTDGLRIAYQVFGDGPRDIVLIPYASCIDVMWEDAGYAHVLTRLAKLGRVICLDPRGNGASDAVPLGAVPTVESWVDDVRVVMDTVGCVTANMIGHGTQGPVAMLFAAAHPERTESLVLFQTAARWESTDDYPAGAPTETIRSFGGWVDRTWGTEESAVLQAPSRGGDDAFARWLGRFERGIGSPGRMLPLWWWSMTHDYRAVVDTIRVPTLVLHRRGSPLVRAEQAEYLAEHIPDAKLVWLTGVDNVFFSGPVDEFVDAIEEFITGKRPIHEADRVLATVLFTDIVESTHQTARVGDRRWHETLDAHDAIVARELERYRGRKITHTGDGMLATFDGPARGVRCAEAISEAVRALGIEVRAGLHIGEIELRGENIGGIAVAIGQRVSALAGPSEVLVSRTVTDLVAGSGLRFEDRGEHELKGVPGSWSIYALLRDDNRTLTAT